MTWLRGLFKRDEPTQQRGPDWRITTPYSTMEGMGVMPWSIVHQLREQDIVVSTWVDGTGDGLKPDQR